MEQTKRNLLVLILHHLREEGCVGKKGGRGGGGKGEGRGRGGGGEGEWGLTKSNRMYMYVRDGIHSEVIS